MRQVEPVKEDEVRISSFSTGLTHIDNHTFFFGNWWSYKKSRETSLQDTQNLKGFGLLILTCLFRFFYCNEDFVLYNKGLNVILWLLRQWSYQHGNQSICIDFCREIKPLKSLVEKIQILLYIQSIIKNISNITSCLILK